MGYNITEYEKEFYEKINIIFKEYKEKNITLYKVNLIISMI